MKHPSRISIDKVWTFPPCLVLVAATFIAVPCLYGQTSSPDDTQYGVMSSLDQDTLYPVQTQMAETSNLNSMNQNADTVKYSDNALTRGPFFFSLETTATGTTNLKNTFDNQPSKAGAYLTFAVPAGVHLSSPASDFSAYFQFNTNIYPGNSDLNHSSEVYAHQLIHQFSERTISSWSLAAAHIVVLGHYLSPVIGIGTTGVVAPQESSGLQPLTDAATTYSISHQTSERNSWSASGTGGWLDQPVIQPVLGTTTKYQQATGGGDVQWQHALNSREIAGVEFTDVYVSEITPSGSGNFTLAKLTFGQTLTPHSSFTAGIGPLYSTSNLSSSPKENILTYAANAGFVYRMVNQEITGGYSRVIELGYFIPSYVANELYFTYDRPLTSNILLAVASQFITSPGFEGRNNYAQFVFNARLDMHLTPTLDYHVEGASFIQDTGAPTPGYSDNEISTGITYYFGNPLSRAGDRQ
jgi:hypothetical protein